MLTSSRASERCEHHLQHGMEEHGVNLNTPFGRRGVRGRAERCASELSIEQSRAGGAGSRRSRARPASRSERGQAARATSAPEGPRRRCRPPRRTPACASSYLRRQPFVERDDDASGSEDAELRAKVLHSVRPREPDSPSQAQKTSALQQQTHPPVRRDAKLRIVPALRPRQSSHRAPGALRATAEHRPGTDLAAHRLAPRSAAEATSSPVPTTIVALARPRERAAPALPRRRPLRAHYPEELDSFVRLRSPRAVTRAVPRRSHRRRRLEELDAS